MLPFMGDGDQKKFTKNPRHFSTQNSQANTKKLFTKFFWRADKVRNLQFRGAVSPLDFCEFSPVDFILLFLQVSSKKITSKGGENCPMSGWRKSVESCHVSGCHGFFSPTNASTEVLTKVASEVVEVHLSCFHLFCLSAIRDSRFCAA